MTERDAREGGGAQHLAACTRCGRRVPPYDGVHRSDGEGGNLGFVCSRCWSEILAESSGRPTSHIELDPIVLRDASGEDHEFHFRASSAPRGLEAFELVNGSPGGYQFQVLQEGDEPGIVEKLLARMRRALAMTHLEASDLTPGALQIKSSFVRGRIDWDSEQEGLPLAVIDGKELTWHELGKMLMTFEGWQFRMEILDPSDEV